MKTIISYTLLGSLAVTIFIACQKKSDLASQASPVTTFHVYLTDHPTPVFDSVFIDLQGLEVRLSDDSLGNDGWQALTIHPGVYNILNFRNGLDTLFATGNIPGNHITKLRLTLGTQNSVMKDGNSFPLRINDHDRQVVVNIGTDNFDQLSQDQILFWLDFDAAQSIRVDNSGPGNNNGFVLKAHLNVFGKSRSGSIEGRILPQAADPVVTAMSATDTASAIPDRHEGEFKIMGLPAGVYTIFVDGNNGYGDTTIHNVIVRKGEDTHLGLISLH
ncbi:MAG: DUF4382 domain-containing protein [Terrimonas sp.]|nr:DUF4382 domain-containing protein [Terrimonas sp.]